MSSVSTSPIQLPLDFDSPWIRPGLEPTINAIRDKTHRVLLPESDLFQGELRPYQHDGVTMLYLTRRLILGDVTGAGKTVQSLRYLTFLKERGELTTDRPALVAVPPNALDSTWMNDGFRLFTPNSLRVVALSGDVTPKDRERVYGMHYPEVILITYPTLLRDVDRLIRAYHDGFATQIFDEGSTFKSHSTSTALAVKRLGGYTPRTIILTATPIQTQLLDLHSLLEGLQLGRIFGTAKAFETRYYNKIMVTRHVRGMEVTQLERSKVQPYKNFGELREKVRPYYYRRNYLDIGSEMPELSFSNRWLDMLPAQRRAYDALRRSQLPPPGPGRRFALQQRARYLKECATSLQTLSPDAEDSSAKLDWLMHQLQTDWSSGGWDGNPVKVVVFSSAKLTILTLMRRLTRAGIGGVVLAGPGDAPGETPFPYGLPPAQREPLRQRFLNDPTCQVLVGTSAIEMALNLPVSPVLVNLDLPTNPARVTQLAGRIWRQNSKYRFVHVINLLARNSVELGTLRVLAERQGLIDAMNGEPSEMFNSLSNDDLERLVTEDWQN